MNDLETLKELMLSANELDIFLLFVASNAKGTDSVVGGIDEIPESRRKAGPSPNLEHCPNREVSLRRRHSTALQSSVNHTMTLTFSFYARMCSTLWPNLDSLLVLRLLL